MAKKRVPDWLNSPLWSVSPNDDRLRYSSATTSSQTDDDTLVQPPASVSPPVSDRPMPPQATPRQGTAHSRSTNGHDDINGRNDPSDVSSRDSEEDISVQAQLLTEVKRKRFSIAFPFYDCITVAFFVAREMLFSSWSLF